ncbi:MAG: DNA polymerase IV [Thermoanaerobaculia bacterium]|nr:DNA polymerase IV [Thermoanaerobaculia bacterium]
MTEPRRILHCDMDCFYAAIHMRDDPSLRGRPLAVGGSPEGRGVVAAANYEARRYGIHSAMPSARAKRRCPHLLFLRPDFTLYREESDRIFSIFREMTPVVQPASLDEAYLDVTDHLAPWGSGTAAAREIRRRVREERGLTVSVGVAPNRLVAKIASDFDKPDGLTVVRPRDVLDFLAPLSVRCLRGVGPATEEKLLQLGVETVAELRRKPLRLLRGQLGSHGETLYRFARGEDDRPVRTERVRKSLSKERTYAEDLHRVEAMEEELNRLAEKVSEGLERRELQARTITIKVRYSDFTTITRSRTLAFPISDRAGIAFHARELLQETEVRERPVRLLGVGGSNLVQGGTGQMVLFAALPGLARPRRD